MFFKRKKEEPEVKTVVQERITYLVIPDNAEQELGYLLEVNGRVSGSTFDYGLKYTSLGYTTDTAVVKSTLLRTDGSARVTCVVLYRTKTGEYVRANATQPVRMYTGDAIEE